jgi:hypothetical protein
MKYIAEFVPENIAGLPLPPPKGCKNTWDCTSFVRSKKWLEIDGTFADFIDFCIDADGEWIDTSNSLRNDPSIPQWMKDWKGPFTIRIVSVVK